MSNPAEMGTGISTRSRSSAARSQDAGDKVRRFRSRRVASGSCEGKYTVGSSAA
jgi:hypothetical protein